MIKYQKVIVIWISELFEKHVSPRNKIRFICPTRMKFSAYIDYN